MKRLVVILALLTGCTPMHNQIYSIDAEPIEYAWVFVAPFCLAFCNTTLSTTGSRINGEGSNTQSTSQTVSTTGGGN